MCSYVMRSDATLSRRSPLERLAHSRAESKNDHIGTRAGGEHYVGARDERRKPMQDSWGLAGSLPDLGFISKTTRSSMSEVSAEAIA